MTSADPDQPRPPTPLDRAFLTNTEDVTELVLVRHGQQVWPDPTTSTVAEWVDPPLSDLGRRQALAVGIALSRNPVHAVYSSQLARAHDTGRAIAAHHGLEVEVVEGLREIETFRDLPQDAHPAAVLGELVLRGARERFVRHRTWDVYPGSERNEEFRHRVVNVIEGIVAGHPGQRVVVACHGGVINAYVGEVLGLATAMFFRPAHASTHRIRAKGDVRALQSLNEVHHLVAESDPLESY
ncbi:MAG: histidine phosphatase family protein [Acidimicrobiales bacterium]|nr:histidine phosphatase family protein [Acidimicrobiales bacterium]